MDPFAKKMVRGSLAFAAVLIVLFTTLTVVYLHVRPRCSDEAVFESLSPDRQWAATAMQRRCGEESSFFTHVNLRPAAQSIRYGFFSGMAGDGEVFLVENETRNANLSLVWNSPDQLTIRCANCAVVNKHEERWRNISIRYELSGR
jgi:hypothetical protein